MKLPKQIEGRCMRCKKQVEVDVTGKKVTKNNMLIAQGQCDECGTTVNRILGKAN